MSIPAASCSSLQRNLTSKVLAIKRIPGLLSYQKGLALQSLCHGFVTNSIREPHGSTYFHDILLLLEHSPTYTAGRRIRGSVDSEGTKLKALGADYVEVQRGGQTTFHGPGQLVGYPILNLKRAQIGVRCYIHYLESLLINSCGDFDLTARRDESATGVWIDNRKIAAIGVHVSRHVSSHGFALNCTTDLSWFDHIIPCGIKGGITTSLSNEFASRATGSQKVSVDDAIPVVLKEFKNVFNYDHALLKDVHPELDQQISDLVNSEG